MMDPSIHRPTPSVRSSLIEDFSSADAAMQEMRCHAANPHAAQIDATFKKTIPTPKPTNAPPIPPKPRDFHLLLKPCPKNEN